MSDLTLEALDKLHQEIEQQTSMWFLFFSHLAPHDTIARWLCVYGKHGLLIIHPRYRKTIEQLPGAQEMSEPWHGLEFAGIREVGQDFLVKFLNDRLWRKCTFCKPEGFLNNEFLNGQIT